MDRRKINRRDNYYRDFYNENEVEDKIKNNELIKSKLINDGTKWFVNNKNDRVYVNNDKDRNRAFDGDLVAVEINPKNKNEGRVVFIFDPKYKKIDFEGKITNEIKNDNKRSQNSLFFIPNDRNVPYFEIKLDTIDKKVLSINHFKSNPENFRYNRYKAKIFEWNSRFKNPLGNLIECITEKSDDFNRNGQRVKGRPSMDNFNRNNQRIRSRQSMDNFNRYSSKIQNKRSVDNFRSGPSKSSNENLTIHLDKNGNRTVDSSRKPLRNSKSRDFRYSISNAKLKKKSDSYYETYISKEEANKGIENKMLFEGKLVFGDDYRSSNSYVLLKDSKDKIFIKSDSFRNRGLDGDEVVVEYLKNDNKAGKIVYIENPSYKDKKISGRILYEVEKSGGGRRLQLFLCPRDRKLPKIEIPRKSIPREILKIKDFIAYPNKYRDMYNFVSQIQHWNENERLPVGKLIENNNTEDLKSSEVSKIIKEIVSSNCKDPFNAIKIKLKTNKNNDNAYFEKYYPIELVEYGIKNGNLFKGKIQVLENKNSDCYVILNDTEEKIIIEDKKKRNRAMHDDEVVVEITDSSSENKKGKVVYLDFEKCVYKNMKIKGTVKYSPEKRRNVSFYPDDKRIPLIDIPVKNIPRNVLILKDYNEETDGNIYFNAKIIKYGNQSWNPLGELIEKLNEVKSSNNNDYYEKYLSEEEVEKGLNDKTLFEGLIRVNSKNGTDSYVTVVGMDKDIRINSVKLRNRALDNDIVIVKLLEGKELENSEEAIQQKKEENRLKDKEMFEKFATKGVKLNDYVEEKNNPLGKVVYVRKSKAKNIDIVGKFKIDSGRNYSNDERFIFYPNDKGIPLIDILAKDIDSNIFDIKDFIDNKEKYEDTLLVARITRWSEMRCSPLGKIVSKLTDEHTIDSRTNIILKTYNIDDSAFYDLITKEIPNDDWEIPEEEIKNRLDLREECIFTIDPPTAKDLDDALSCKRLEDGNYEVGIHIADVSYFVTPNSNMDSEAFKRGTSTYLVQKVIPMLPKVLCENLCSLNAGTSRLAFSVIIKMDKDGHVLESKAAKTVICSCAKLAYDHAQRVIDNNGEWPKENEGVEINNPYHTYTSEDVRDRINDLYRLSRIMKEERYANGAVSLNRKKLWFELSDELPLDFGIYETREANSLVEEFMLLANTTVANMLYKKYSNESLLRCHEAPTPENVNKYLKLIEMTKKLVIDASDSKAFHDSLISIKEAGSIYSDVALSKCIKFMKRANYICSSADHPESLFHYGLHIPFYTHFTSPIRRYPDIIVHRQLKSILDEKPSPYDSKKIREIAKQSNDTKANAKKAQDDSNNLYLIYLLQEYLNKTQREYIIEDALVIGFDNYYIECTLPKFAYEDKISINQLYEKDIVKGVEVFKPEAHASGEEVNNDEPKEVSFDVYWNEDVNMNNILEKFNAEIPDKVEVQQQDKPLNIEDLIKNTSVESFDNIDGDDEFDSDEALEKFVEAAEAAADTGADDEADEEKLNRKLEKIKEGLTNCPKQNFKIFSSFKVLLIPNFDKMKIKVLLAPPDVIEHNSSNESYQSHSIADENGVVVYEPEGGYD